MMRRKDQSSSGRTPHRDGAELVRDVTEGSGHTGDAAVVQVLARKP